MYERLVKRVILILTILAAATACIYKGRLAYRRFKESRAIAQAQKFVQRGDFSNASLSAVQALTELQQAAKGLPKYHVLAAQLALKLNHADEAEWHFEEAARLEPTNDV